VSNTGSRAGAEVVQVYIEPISPPIRRPLKGLKGFAKRQIEAGQSAEVIVEIDVLRDTSFWEEKEGRWCSHAGMYNVLVGTSSAGCHLSGSIVSPKARYWLSYINVKDCRAKNVIAALVGAVPFFEVVSSNPGIVATESDYWHFSTSKTCLC
jgi:hypothetical protein